MNRTFTQLRRFLLILLVNVPFLIQAQTFTIGTGTATNGTGNSFPAPYNNFWGVTRNQFLIRASELTALGATAGSVRNIAFNVLAPNSTNNTLAGFTISLGQTAATALTGFVNAGLTTVYSQNYAPVVGWNVHEFTNCFAWDGTSNLIVNVCYTSGASSTAGAQTYWTTGVGFNASCYSISAACGGTTGATTSTSRPNMKISIYNKKDAAVVAVPSPGSSAIVNAPNVVTATVKNTGCIPFTTVQVGYKYNNEPPVIETLNTGILPGATANYTFTAPFTPVNLGYNTLKVWVSGPDGTIPDADPSNDTLRINNLFVINDPSTNPTAYTGTDFWVGFMKNNDNGASNPTPPFTQTLYLTSNSGTANVTVSAPKAVPGAIWTTTVSVPAGQITSVVVPNTINSIVMATATANVVSKTGIHVVSNNNIPITVYGLSRMFASTDGYLSIPTSSLDKTYIAVAPIGFPSSLTSSETPSEILIIATTDNTTATVTLPAGVSVVGRAAGSTFNTPVLNAGETFLMQTNGGSTAFNLTGTYITANNKISVLQGTVCANIPNTCSYCDHVNEMTIPTVSWGKRFYLANFAVKNSGDIVRVVSLDPGTTTFSFTGLAAQTLVGRGAWRDYTITGGAELISDKSLYVVQMCKGGSCDNPATISDPFILNIIPAEQWGNLYTFTAPPLSFSSHYVNIIKRSATGRAALDGVFLNNASFTRIGTTPYYYLRQAISEGQHTVNGDSALTAYVYGFNNDDSYGYPASGASVAPIALPVAFGDITATKVDKNVVNVVWNTILEQNNSKFVLERSIDAVNFNEIATIIAKGNSNTPTKYNYIDQKALSAINYYRIKQIDNDGKYSYSTVIAVDMNESSRELNVYPNIVEDKANLSFLSNGSKDMTLEIIDMNGRVVFTKQYNDLNQEQNNLNIDLGFLASGSYFVKLNLQTENLFKKFIKK